MAAVTGVATPCNRSCFPIMSFLHVPGKMSQPLWLMMGTAFLVRVPGGAHLGGPTFNDSAYARNLNCGTRRVLLTAKHTFVPWQYTDPQKLKIPEEFRKTRFVIGRLYLPDDEGRAVGSRTVDLQLMALHPSLDISLVAVRPTSRPLQGLPGGCGHATVGGAWEAHAELERRAEAAGGGLELSVENPAEGSLCRIFGYRGTGLLGELDTFDPELLQRVSSETREQLLESMNCVEGKQEGASTQVEVLSSEGMCRMVTGRCFHGMSGAPLLVDEKTCGGVLYGKHPSGENAIGYVPVRSFVDFVLESLRRESVS